MQWAVGTIPRLPGSPLNPVHHLTLGPKVLTLGPEVLTLGLPKFNPRSSTNPSFQTRDLTHLTLNHFLTTPSLTLVLTLG